MAQSATQSQPRKSLLIFDTHPIQYRAPVFKALFKKDPSTEVFYFNQQFDGSKWWFHEVGKIPKQDFKIELREGFPSQILHTKDMTFFQKVSKLKQILKEANPSAVALYGYYLPEHWILRFLTQFLSIPLIFIGETYENRNPGWRQFIKRPLISLFFSGVSQFIAIGNKTKKYYEQSYHVSKSKIVGAKYCTDVSFFELDPIESTRVREQWRKDNHIEPEDFVMLFVGRLFERKRPLDVLKIHQSLSRHKKVHTLMVGNGPMEAILRNLTQDLKNFHFLGFRNQHQLKEIYHATDLLLVPSEYETWGLVTNEAFAAGTTAIVSDTCGCANDLVIPNETGMVFPLGEVQKATSWIETLLAQPSLLEEIKSKAKEKVSREFHCEQFADAFVSAKHRIGNP